MNFKSLSSLFSFILIFSVSSCSEKKNNNNQVTQKKDNNNVAWMSIEEAEAASLKNPKPLYVMVYANWCPHCKNFDKTTYKDPKVIQELNNNFYPVKINAHSNQTITYRSNEYTNPNFDTTKSKNEANSYHELLYEIEAKSIPSIVFIDSNFNVKGTELGFKPADELRSLIGMYKNY